MQCEVGTVVGSRAGAGVVAGSVGDQTPTCVAFQGFIFH